MHDEHTAPGRIDARIAYAPRGDANEVVLADVPLPQPRPRQVVVRLEAAGVCATQVHQLHKQREADTLLGHEAVGTVIGRGEGATRVRMGRRVVLSWIPPLGSATPQPASVALDDNRTAVAASVYAFADHVVVDEAYVTEVPESFLDRPAEELAIVGCALLTGAGAVVRSGGMARNENVVVIGAGGIGLAAIGAATAAGAARVIAVDVDPGALELARDLCGALPVDASIEAPTEVLARHGVDAALVIDAAGTRATTALAVSAVRRARLGASPGGRLVLVGGRSYPLELDSDTLVTGGLTVIGCLGGDTDVDVDIGRDLALFDRLGAGALGRIVTWIVGIDELPRVLADMARGEVRGRAVVRF